MATIRSLQRNDQKQIESLFFQLTNQECAVNIDALISDQSCSCIVIEEGETVIGFASLIIYYLPTVGRVGKIEDVIVDEKYRRKGLGRLLVEKLIEIAKEKELRKIQLTSSPRRVAARALYQSLGFAMKDTNVFVMDLT